MIKVLSACYAHRHKLVLASLVWAGFAQGAGTNCARTDTLQDPPGFPGVQILPVSDGKTNQDKAKKTGSGGSTGILRMLIPSALRHSASS